MLSKSAARAFFLSGQGRLSQVDRRDGPQRLPAVLFSVGILAYVYTFVKSGWPVGEVNPSVTPEYA